MEKSYWCKKIIVSTEDFICFGWTGAVQFYMEETKIVTIAFLYV